MGKELPKSNYFTIVVYPNEMPVHYWNLFFQLGTVFISPLHNGDVISRCYTALYGVATVKKQHYHLLFKCSNKITENAFIMRLCDLLDNDFTGVALHKGDSLVKSPEIMLRYFFHLDNPTKEHFNIELAFEDKFLNFTEEIIKAFNLEITLRISFAIQSGEVQNIQQILTFYKNSAITTKWLYTGRNMYVVNSMFNEVRRNERYSK